MKKNVNPLTALVALLLTLSCAGYALWYFGLRERPRPEHVGLPGFLRKMEDDRNARFKKSLAEQEVKRARKSSGSSNSKGAAPESKGASDVTSSTDKHASAGTRAGE